jgi:hypothetical protein
MELFFGAVDFEEFDNVDPSDTFKHNGSHYWYRAVIDNDQICFYDTCGRHFPIALENAKEADVALFAARKIHDMTVECERVQERTMSELDQLVEFFDKVEGR